jgi:hypothetical protein
VPKAVEGDAGDPSTDDGRLPDPATEQAAGQWTAPRGCEDQRIGLRTNEVREVLLQSGYVRGPQAGYLATPDRQVACSWPSLWITAAAANPYRLPKVANCRRRSFSAEKFGAERTAFVRRPTSELLGTSLTLLRGAAGPVHVQTRSSRKCHAAG